MGGVSLFPDEQTTTIRKVYLLRLFLRCAIFICCILLLLFRPMEFVVLEKRRFFSRFSPLHLLWGIWVADMLGKLVPVQKTAPLGSQKLFRQRYRPAPDGYDRQALRRYLRFSAGAALRVMVLWAALIAAIGVLYFTEKISTAVLFLISVFFYVCDLICVLIWCPFRLILKNRCCTACRIFNWDHLMMFSPMVFLDSFYFRSLLGLSAALWLIWEGSVLLHPERFWEDSNIALRCSECTDKLCTQYCRRTRR